jgi:hypothetical protein
LNYTFDREDFKRSAAVLPELPTDAQAVKWAYNHRPPTMIERKLADARPTSYSAQELTYGNQYQAQQFAQPSYRPTDQSQTEIHPVHTPNTGEPFLPPSVFAQAAYSHLPSPVSASYETSQERNDSTDAHYANPGRSSMPPSQAAQYAELAMRLNADVLGPLPDYKPVTTDHKSSSSFDIAAKKPTTRASSYTAPSIAAANENVSVARSTPSIATANENVPIARSTPDIATANENIPISYTAPSVATAHENISIENSQSAEIEISPFADTAAMLVQEPEEQDTAATVEGDEDESATFRSRISSIPPVLPDVYQRTFSPTPFSATFNSVMSPGAYDSSPSADQGPPAPAPASIPTPTPIPIPIPTPPIPVPVPVAPAVATVAMPRVDPERNTSSTLYDPDDAY